MEIVDYVEDGVDPTVSVVHPSHSVYVDKETYRQDVIKKGKLTMKWKLTRQMSRDLARCTFSLNGTPHRTIPDDLPVWTYPFCTQAVMGLPVSILSHDLVILERTIPVSMEIDVYSGIDTIIDIYKGLSCVRKNTNEMFDIDIHIRINEIEDTVLISFITLNPDDTNDCIFKDEYLMDPECSDGPWEP